MDREPPVAVAQDQRRTPANLIREGSCWRKIAALTRLRQDVVEMLEAHGNVMTRQKLADAPPGVWLLVPCDAQKSRPLIDGKPVPVFTAAQWARIPAAWLAARIAGSS